eukprot:CAMPEP_0194329198 /NCGR_PEP_ID=MMETSP0171-20130528/47402_1 /TAXON_ID=218684 /ORGANISM="Corethron pennatum, Strain L29A3" /LENGTH=168 /DNA_ID=CAMNT_0039089853 /DNA_START=725 /DNA_END=1231 /DNA_ORIENTATION=+
MSGPPCKNEPSNRICLPGAGEESHPLTILLQSSGDDPSRLAKAGALSRTCTHCRHAGITQVCHSCGKRRPMHPTAPLRLVVQVPVKPYPRILRVNRQRPPFGSRIHERVRWRVCGQYRGRHLLERAPWRDPGGYPVRRASGMFSIGGSACCENGGAVFRQPVEHLSGV